MGNTVIRVENLYKEYRLGVVNHDTLTHDLQSWWARIRGKEDPNSLISEHHNIDAEKNSFLALKDISFEVKQGDRVGIIGKNGAGKSTLLKIMSKITSPTRGQVKIKGRVGSLLEVGTGFHTELTGRENIYLNGAILGMSRKEIDRKFDEIVDFSGIEKHIDTPVKRYSSGMNVRLGFAVAAHLDPEILIVDEVLAVGDAEFQKKAIGKMEEVSKGEGRTILFVSHNMSTIRGICNSAILLDNGIIKSLGLVDDVINTYKNTRKKSFYYNDLTEDSNFGIKSVKLKNNDNLITDVFSMSDFLIVDCIFFNNRKMDLTLSIQIKEFDDQPIYHFPSGDANHILPSRVGDHFIKIKIPPLYLYPGKYIIRLALVQKNSRNFVEVDDIIFEVIQDYNICKRPLPRKAGLIFKIPEWENSFPEK